MYYWQQFACTDHLSHSIERIGWDIITECDYSNDLLFCLQKWQLLRFSHLFMTVRCHKTHWSMRSDMAEICVIPVHVVCILSNIFSFSQEQGCWIPFKHAGMLAWLSLNMSCFTIKCFCFSQVRALAVALICHSLSVSLSLPSVFKKASQMLTDIYWKHLCNCSLCWSQRGKQRLTRSWKRCWREATQLSSLLE